MKLSATNLLKLVFSSLLFIVVLFAPALAADPDGLKNYNRYEERIEWFKKAKFGIFVHWGLYAQVGYNEWCQNHFEIQAEDYSKLMDTFNPVDYKPSDWADLFKKSGAKYVVITSKHHEGFSMYDTKYSDYSIMNSPYGKDVIDPLSKAVRDNGLRFGIYYSVMDWHHDDYLPRRYFDKRPSATADSGKYKLFFKNQVGELIDKFNPTILWFDGEWENTHDSLETVGLVDMMLSKNPGLIFNNRLSRSGYGDFKTPENQVPPTGLFNDDGTPQVWETCSTMGDGWGYDPYADTFYSNRDLIRMLIDVCSKGGNLLLNVGPTPEGTIRCEHKTRLEDIGIWLSVNGEAIYGTTASIFEKLPFYGKSTTKGSTLYLHVFMKPKSEILPVPLLENKIQSITLLDGNIPLDYETRDNQVQVNLPDLDYDKDAFVVKIEVEGKPVVKTLLPSYGKGETIVCDGINAIIESPGRHLLEKVQYYDKILVKNWNEDSKDAQLVWEFEVAHEGEYRLEVQCASASVLKGTIGVMCSVDSTALPFTINEKPRWTATNKLLYEPYKPGRLFLDKGMHRVVLKADSLENKQEIVFRELRLVPVH